MRTLDFKILVIVLAVICLMFVTLINQANAADVPLAWDHNDPLPEGYKVFVRLGSTPYDYNTPAWTGPGNTAQVTVPDSTIFHAVCRAYDGVYESEDSNEITYLILMAPLNFRKQ